MRRKEREVKDVQGLKDVLDKTSVCSIAMVDNGTPYVIPLNYGYTLTEGTLTLYFHCAPKGRKLEILKENPEIAFEIHWEGEIIEADKPCKYSNFFASVVGSGKAVFVEDPVEKEVALKAIMQHLTKKDFAFDERAVKSVFIFKIVSTDFCGKKN